ncbi:MAG: cohesin domain-containing protein [bacterium]
MQTKARIHILTAVAALTFLSLFLPGGAQSLADAPAQVTLEVPSEVAPDSDFTVKVNIGQVTNFDAASYNVSFDSALLRLDNVTSGQIGSKTVPVDIWNEKSPGTYVIVQNVSGLSGVSGSGYLAVLYFHNISSQNKLAIISLSNGVLSNNLAQTIPATWAINSVSLLSLPPPPQPSPPPSVTPTPASPPPATPLSPAPVASVTDAFSVKDLVVSPIEVMAGEAVTIKAVVSNSGASEGSYEAILKIGDAVEATKTVKLAAGGSEQLAFNVSKAAAGSYTVSIGGLSGAFMVKPEPAVPPAGPTAKPSPSTQLPPPSPEAAVEAETAAINWPVLWGVIGVVAIVIGLVILVRARSRFG